MSETCSTCRWWGTMGKCNKQSGMRSMGGISFHQLVMTCPMQALSAALAPFTKGQNDG